MGTLRSKLLVSLAALAAILVPCATAAHSTFVSHRYHYSLQVPDGFHVRAATLSIVPGFYPSTPGPAADRFIQGTNTIVVASTALSEPESLSAWVKSRISVIAALLPVHQSEDPRDDGRRLGGRRARLPELLRQRLRRRRVGARRQGI